MSKQHKVTWFQTTSRGNDYLLINVNEVKANGSIEGCANVAFNGTGDDLPSDHELKTCVLEVHGDWTTVPPSNWSKHESQRFVVSAWRILELPKAALNDVPKVQRSKRLPSRPVQPAKVTCKRVTTPTHPTKQAVANTNDWYANGGDKLPASLSA